MGTACAGSQPHLRPTAAPPCPGAPHAVPRPGPVPQPLLVRAAAAYVTRMLSVFGLAPAPGDFLGFAEPGVAGASDDALHAVLDAFCEFRRVLRRRGWWAAARTAAWPAHCSCAAACRHAAQCAHTALRRSLRPLRRDAVRGLAKAKAPAAELQAACAGMPSEVAAAAGASGRPKELLAVFSAFHADVAALAAAAAPPADILAVCDRCAAGWASPPGRCRDARPLAPMACLIRCSPAGAPAQSLPLFVLNFEWAAGCATTRWWTTASGWRTSPTAAACGSQRSQRCCARSRWVLGQGRRTWVLHAPLHPASPAPAAQRHHRCPALLHPRCRAGAATACGGRGARQEAAQPAGHQAQGGRGGRGWVRRGWGGQARRLAVVTPTPSFHARPPPLVCPARSTSPPLPSTHTHTPSNTGAGQV